MVILIAGETHTGKTLLAQKLLELPVNKAITALAQLGDSVEDEQ